MFKLRSATFAVALLIAPFFAGCGDAGFDLSANRDSRSAPAAGQTTRPGEARPSGDRETLRIATFNIQVFGKSKLAKAPVMDVLARVVRRFDVVAIQEVRSKDQTVVPRFVDLINQDGSRFDFAIGPRLGRTSSKEQYAYIFNTDTVEIDRDWIYTADDRDDLLHREPLVAAFRARAPKADAAFTFTLINIHTDPDETDQELDALDDVFTQVQHDGSGEDDVILLGDLNVDEYHLGQLGRLPGIMHIIAGVPTNTRGNHTYDNMLFDRRATVEYSGSAGVLNLMSEFNLTLEQALKVSDHMPVWAEFSIYEGGRAHLAGKAAEPVR